jgi:hypothetical protein
MSSQKKQTSTTSPNLQQLAVAIIQNQCLNASTRWVTLSKQNLTGGCAENKSGKVTKTAWSLIGEPLKVSLQLKPKFGNQVKTLEEATDEEIQEKWAGVKKTDITHPLYRMVAASRGMTLPGADKFPPLTLNDFEDFI